jgi:hypothetical protein
MESVGFKEWALVCEALGRGEQTIILRKGGIAEGREGFSFKHREFFLFPTFFHEQVEKVRGEARALPAQRDGEIEVRFFARVELTATITSIETALALEAFHILQPEVVRERFEYDEAPGIHVAFVRVFRLAGPWSFPDARQYGGCRSWVQLPAAPQDIALEPVLGDIDSAARLADFAAIAGQEATAVV